MPTFSSNRLILIFSWIGLAALILFINSYFNPNYIHNTTFVLVALICFMNAGLLATGLLGLNKKVQDIESTQWQYEFKEKHKEEITHLRKQIGFQVLTEAKTENQEELEIKQFNEQMESATTSWKSKNRTDFSPFEKFHYLQHKIKMLKKISEVLSLFISLSSGLVILNLPLLSYKEYLGYIALLISLSIILFISASLSKKSRKMRELIYPKTVKNFLKDVNIW
jgi:hypothetical protein